MDFLYAYVALLFVLKQYFLFTQTHTHTHVELHSYTIEENQLAYAIEKNQAKRKETRARSKKRNEKKAGTWQGKREGMKEKCQNDRRFQKAKKKHANTSSVLSFIIWVAGYRWTQFRQKATDRLPQAAH